MFYGVPHALGSIWDKLKLKLDLFFLGKILLKLIIFKKIVSFIAVICLLLFIPSLKKKLTGSSEDDSLMRSLSKEKLGKSNQVVYICYEQISIKACTAVVLSGPTVNISTPAKASLESDTPFSPLTFFNDFT